MGVIAIDQGTTATKAVLFGDRAETIGHATVPVGRSYPRPGWVEQDPIELWESACTAVSQLPTTDVRAIALSSQRESVLIWDRDSGAPLTPCVSWQCTRGTEICRELAAAGAEELVRELTGLPLDPMFSAPKLRWLLDSDPDLRAAAAAGDVCAGTVDSWLIYQLTGGRLHVSDHGCASRTLLMDIGRRDWSDALLSLFDVPRACLPQLVASDDVAAEVVVAGMPQVTIGASLADSHAAAIGLECLGPGFVKASYGTGTSLLAPLGPAGLAAQSALAGTVAWAIGDAPTYALEGNVFSSGATVEWVAGLLGIGDAGALQRLADEVDDTAGVELVPAFSGLGAPFWRPDARALICGLTFAAGRAQVARAAIDSIALQVTDLALALSADLAEPFAELRVDGGASRNDRLMQLQADLLGAPVARLDDVDAAARGAALVALGFMGQRTQVPYTPDWTRFEPQMAEQQRTERLDRWHVAVARALEAREQAIA